MNLTDALFLWSTPRVQANIIRTQQSTPYILMTIIPSGLGFEGAEFSIRLLRNQWGEDTVPSELMVFRDFYPFRGPEISCPCLSRKEDPTADRCTSQHHDFGIPGAFEA